MHTVQSVGSAQKADYPENADELQSELLFGTCP